MSAAIQRFGAAFAALHAELDWERLGSAYCVGDASGFFDAALRERLLDTGLQWADDLANRLAPDGPRRSLYVGAALAELAPILAERLVLGREVHWYNLAGPETSELQRALGQVATRLGLDLPRPVTGELAGGTARDCDHLWLVSVLTDPDAFPALHDELYERTGSELATGRGDLERERRQAERLASDVLDCAAGAGSLTSTDEELTVLAPMVRSRGWSFEVPAGGRLSPIVGDLVRMCRWRT